MQPAFEPVAEIPVDEVDAARVYEHGWQSWSPTTTYGLRERPLRPGSTAVRVLHCRPEVDPPADAFWGEGLLAVDPGGGAPVHVFGAPDPRADVPSIRARALDGRVVVDADGPLDRRIDDGPGGIDGALARWADDLAARLGVAPPPPAPTAWCSWYQR